MDYNFSIYTISEEMFENFMDDLKGVEIMKIIKKAFIFFSLSVLLTTMFYTKVKASTSIIKTNYEQVKFVYLKDNFNNQKQNNESVIEKNIAEISLEDILNTQVFIVELELLQDKDKCIFVKNLIQSGKMVFIHAEAYEANRTLIHDMLNFPEKNGELITSSDIELKERINTYGYIVYIENNILQVVRQLYDNSTAKLKNYINNDLGISIEQLETLPNDEKNKVRSKIESKKIDLLRDRLNMSFDDQIEAIEDFISYNGANHSGTTNGIQSRGLNASFDYEVLYDTITYLNVTGSSIGSITRTINAKRLNAASAATKQWAFVASVDMSPKYSSNKKVANDALVLGLSTYPVGTSNITYKQVIMDYLPKTDTSGQSSTTYSIGASLSNSGVSISGGATWTATYKDVDFKVDRVSGANTNHNYIRWDFVMPIDNRNSLKNVHKSTICLIGGVRIANSGPKKTAVQLNVKSYWYQVVGSTNATDLRYAADVGGTVWILPVK